MADGQNAPAVVLFDLDGTLIDSVADLGRAANAMRLARGLGPLPLEVYRPHGGSGARGMLMQAFGLLPEAPSYADFKAEFLDVYEGLMHDTTELFEGVRELLRTLELAGLPWGIVTNKAARFAQPLVSSLELQPAVLICGDTTPHVKPHPAPLEAAARCMGVLVQACIYVGDDKRDMRAARAARMQAAAATWGYLGDASPPSAWGADLLLHQPAELLKHVRLA